MISCYTLTDAQTQDMHAMHTTTKIQQLPQTTTATSVKTHYSTPPPQSPVRDDDRLDPVLPPIFIPGGIGPLIVDIPDACVRTSGGGSPRPDDAPLDLDLARPASAMEPPRPPCIQAPPPAGGGPPRLLNVRGPTGSGPGLALAPYMLLCLPLPRRLPSACLLSPRLLPLPMSPPRWLPPPALLRGLGGALKSGPGRGTDRGGVLLDPRPVAMPGGRRIRGGAPLVMPPLLLMMYGSFMYGSSIPQGPGYLGPPFGIWALYLRFAIWRSTCLGSQSPQRHMVGWDVS